ncbi:MAG: dNTP triphosphohydrolase, partial [Alphaproteobacteria bacterium]|nr:dNTP triphosphohydrolase [Alphaproteobacteria bacterium]
MNLNEDLTETIALAHDLGHTCFGHAGETALADVMKPYGGFDHNEQTFRILTQLERRYVEFDGLNLTWETLEGIVKHNGPLVPEKDGAPVPATIAAYNEKCDLELTGSAGPEAQVAAMADDIAYNTHDIDDGLRAGLFGFDDLRGLPMFGPIMEDMQRHHPDVEKPRLLHAVVRQVIGSMIVDLLDTSRAAILTLNPKGSADIRRTPNPTIRLSFAMQQYLQALREFLRSRMYGHEKVNQACAKAESLVRELFAAFIDKPALLPEDWFRRLRGSESDDMAKARLIGDYIAGMTDRYARLEYRRLFAKDVIED